MESLYEDFKNVRHYQEKAVMKKSLLVLFTLAMAVWTDAVGQTFTEDFGTTSTVDGTKWPSTCRSGMDEIASVGCSSGATDFVGRLNASGEYLTTQALTASITGTMTITFSYNFNGTSGAPTLQYGTGASCPASPTTIATLSGTADECHTVTYTISVTAATVYWIRWRSNSATVPFYLDDVSISVCTAATGSGCSTLAGTSNRLVSKACGPLTACATWNMCTTTCADPCTVWGTLTVDTRNLVIRNNVTIDAGFTTLQDNARSIYIDPGASLTLNTGYPGNTSGSYTIEVCGTLNVVSGTSDFGNHDLVINSGGVVNMIGGTLEVDAITVKNGGILNMNGGDLRRACGSGVAQGLTVEETGVVNINSATSQLRINSSCFGEPYTLLDGTIDAKNNITSGTVASRFQLGYCRVTNSTSTGLIKTQTAYTPTIYWQTSPSITSRSANGNFTGYNSTYGGTVQYYGSSTITLTNLDLQSLYQYYNMEVKMNGGAELRLGHNTYCDVVGVLYLTSGNLNLNGKKLRLRGDIIYGTGKLYSSNNASELMIVGKLSGATPDFVSSGMTTYEIWAKSKAVSANNNCRNPEIRFDATNYTLGKFHLQREDVTHLTTNLTVTDTTRLLSGILNVNSGIVFRHTNTDSGSVVHRTTGWSYGGWVSGRFRRDVVAGGVFDFPVGYKNIGTINSSSDFYDANRLKHRRYTLKLNAATGTTYVDGDFNPPTDQCTGTMPVLTEDGVDYIGIHPEGFWRINPDAGSGFDYNARLFVHGFFGTGNDLIDNEFGGLKRPDGGACGDWTYPPATRPSPNQPGRIIQEVTATLHEGYAERLNWLSFSEQAIGIGGDTPLPLAEMELAGRADANGIALNWRGLADATNYELKVGETSLLSEPRECTARCGYVYMPPRPGLYSFQVTATTPDGKAVKSNVAQVQWNGNLSLQPNPVAAGTTFALTLPEAAPATVQLHNTLGQMVWQQQLNGDAMALPVPQAAGTYILRVQQNGAWYTRQLMVR